MHGKVLNIVCVFVLMCGSFMISAHGQTLPDENGRHKDALSGFELDTLAKTYIWFRNDDEAIDSNYMDNLAALASIRKALAVIERDSLKSISSILIEGTASPVGREEYNLRLSARRANTIADFLNSIPDISRGKYPVTVRANGEDWHTFTEDIRKNYDRPNKAELMDILESDAPNAAKEDMIRAMDRNSYTWRLLVRDYMATSRHTSTMVVLKTRRILDMLKPLPYATDRPVQTFIDTLCIPHKEVERRRTIAALKTNLLYDAVTALNFAVEIPLWKDFSVLYEQHTPWWETGNRYCMQFLTFGGEFRWWFASKPQAAYGNFRQRDALMGHFVGINGWGGKGDVQVGRRFGCYQFDFWSAGLTYGYAMPIGDFLNLEFSISAGYANIPYQHYIPAEDWSILIKDNSSAGRLHYIGPTKAEVSLVLPIRVKVGGKR